MNFFSKWVHVAEPVCQGWQYNWGYFKLNFYINYSVSEAFIYMLLKCNKLTAVVQKLDWEKGKEYLMKHIVYDNEKKTSFSLLPVGNNFQDHF